MKEQIISWLTSVAQDLITWLSGLTETFREWSAGLQDVWPLLQNIQIPISTEFIIRSFVIGAVFGLLTVGLILWIWHRTKRNLVISIIVACLQFFSAIASSVTVITFHRIALERYQSMVDSLITSYDSLFHDTFSNILVGAEACLEELGGILLTDLLPLILSSAILILAWGSAFFYFHLFRKDAKEKLFALPFVTHTLRLLFFYQLPVFHAAFYPVTETVQLVNDILFLVSGIIPFIFLLLSVRPAQKAPDIYEYS